MTKRRDKKEKTAPASGTAPNEADDAAAAAAAKTRGQERLSAGDAEGAIADLEKAVLITPKDAEAQFLLGNGHLATGQRHKRRCRL